MKKFISLLLTALCALICASPSSAQSRNGTAQSDTGDNPVAHVYLWANNEIIGEFTGDGNTYTIEDVTNPASTFGGPHVRVVAADGYTLHYGCDESPVVGGVTYTLSQNLMGVRISTDIKRFNATVTIDPETNAATTITITPIEDSENRDSEIVDAAVVIKSIEAGIACDLALNDNCGTISTIVNGPYLKGIYLNVRYGDASTKQFVTENSVATEEGGLMTPLTEERTFDIDDKISQAFITFNIVDGVPVSYTLSDIIYKGITEYGITTVDQVGQYSYVRAQGDDDKYINGVDLQWHEDYRDGNKCYVVTVSTENEYKYYGINTEKPEYNVTYELSTENEPFAVSHLFGFKGELTIDGETGEPRTITFIPEYQVNYVELYRRDQDGSEQYMGYGNFNPDDTWKNGTVTFDKISLYSDDYFIRVAYSNGKTRDYVVEGGIAKDKGGAMTLRTDGETFTANDMIVAGISLQVTDNEIVSYELTDVERDEMKMTIQSDGGYYSMVFGSDNTTDLYRPYPSQTYWIAISTKYGNSVNYYGCSEPDCKLDPDVEHTLVKNGYPFILLPDTPANFHVSATTDNRMTAVTATFTVSQLENPVISEASIRRLNDSGGIVARIELNGTSGTISESLWEWREGLYLSVKLSDGTTKEYVVDGGIATEAGGAAVLRTGDESFGLQDNIYSATITFFVENGEIVSYSLSDIIYFGMYRYGITPKTVIDNNWGWSIPAETVDDKYIINPSNFRHQPEFQDDNKCYIIKYAAETGYIPYGITAEYPETNVTYELSREYPPFVVSHLFDTNFTVELTIDPETGEPLTVNFATPPNVITDYGIISAKNVEEMDYQFYPAEKDGDKYTLNGEPVRWNPDFQDGQGCYILSLTTNKDYIFYGIDAAIPETDVVYTLSKDYPPFAVSHLDNFVAEISVDPVTGEPTEIIFRGTEEQRTIPIKTTAVQEMDEDGRYTLNVRLDIEPVEGILEKECGAGTVKDAMKYYVITVPSESIAKRLNGAGESPFMFTQAGEKEIPATRENQLYLCPGEWYARIPITDEMKETGDLAITLTWHNVLPTESNVNTHLKMWNEDKSALTEVGWEYTEGYSFHCYLVGAESDIDNWEKLNLTTSYTGTGVQIPSTLFDVKSVGLQPSSRSFEHRHVSNHTHPSGSRLTAFDGEGNPDFDNPAIVSPVKYTRFNETFAPATIFPLQVADDVINNCDITYLLYVMPDEVTLDGNYNNSTYNIAIYNANEIARDGADLTLYDIDLSAVGNNPAKIENAIDGYGSRIAANCDNMTFATHILVEYTIGGVTIVNDSQPEDQNIPFLADFKTPKDEPVKTYYHNYLAEYYHNGADNDGNPDDWGDTKPGKGKLGWFAYATTEFNFDLETELEAYAAFHIPQQVMYHEDHRGCYGQNNPGGSDGLERPWYMYPFAGTRAANGGHPMNFSSSDIEPLEGYTPHDGATPWTDSWTEANDWSSIAVKTGRLPIQINPVYYHGDEVTSDLSDCAPIEGYLAAVYPVAQANGLSVTIHPTNGPVGKAPATRELDGLLLFQAKTSASVDLHNAKIQTGVDPVMGDLEEDAPVEYYNLQGIRVANPAKGQVYIMRRGGKASKVLVK